MKKLLAFALGILTPATALAYPPGPFFPTCAVSVGGTTIGAEMFVLAGALVLGFIAVRRRRSK